MGNLMRGRDETSELYRECEHKYKNADAKDMSSVVEAYLSEMKRRQGNKDDSLSPDQIYQVLSDILAMGMETTMHSVHWLFIYLAMYPEVQVAIYWFKNLVKTFGMHLEKMQLKTFIWIVLSRLVFRNTFLKNWNMHLDQRRRTWPWRTVRN